MSGLAQPLRLHCISCRVLARELRAAAARSPHIVHFEFLPMSLHSGERPAMRSRIQAAVDRVDPAQADAILVGYGLCGLALEGLTAHAVRLVVPRAHDCIGVLFGGERKLDEFLRAHPGTYFRSPGWLEAPRRPADVRHFSAARGTGVGRSYEELAARYGEDNARHLFEILGQPTRHYSRLAYIRTGTAGDPQFERMAREEAARRDWSFEAVEGDLSCVQRCLRGDWREDEFLVVAPGRRIVATHDDRVMDAVSVTDRAGSA